MKILPINNIQNNRHQNFKAKFPKSDIKEFLRETHGGDVDILPQLYTMLDVIKKQPGNIAKIEHIGSWHKILIDGKSLSDNKQYFCAIHALKDATVKQKSTLITDSVIKRLSEEEFEREYFNNSKKTINDIINIFEG